jgi:hypothetical protein
MSPPPAQRAMADRAGATVDEVAADHSLHVSQARATAEVIKQDSLGPYSSNLVDTGQQSRRVARSSSVGTK